MRIEHVALYVNDLENLMVMRLSVDHGLQVMDITKVVSLRLRIIKLRLQYN